MNYVKFTNERLNVEDLNRLASSPSCGAISIFVGTTRDTFEDKTVVHLEYEAYESMGIKAMERICDNIRQKWTEVENIVIYHRLGSVPVQEASIVIAISSPHRKQAINATEWCIDEVKRSVPIWKKEIYKDNKAEWKENKESDFKTLQTMELEIIQSTQVPPVPQHLIQIRASNDEINKRIANFMERKRNEIDEHNIREFCPSNRNSEYICARVDAVLRKQHDSKSHLEVNRVLNSFYRDQMNSDYLTKYIPHNGIEERLQNLELQLSMTTAVPKNIYERLKKLEDRMLYLESISPEYINFWDKASLNEKSAKRKKVFSIQEIDSLIADLESKIANGK